MSFAHGRAGRVAPHRLLALALVLALHLALVLGLPRWDGRASGASAPVARMAMVSIGPPRPAPLPAAAPQTRPRAPTVRRPSVPGPVPVPVPAPAPAQAIVTVPPTGADPVLPAADPVLTAAMIEGFKRDAGKIDRELRGAAPALPRIRPDSPLRRLERGMAAAYAGGSMGFTIDRYVAPDGVIVTRKRTAGGAACYMSGTVNFMPGILRDSSRPQRVNCPPDDAGWIK